MELGIYFLLLTFHVFFHIRDIDLLRYILTIHLYMTFLRTNIGFLSFLTQLIRRGKASIWTRVDLRLQLIYVLLFPSLVGTRKKNNITVLGDDCDQQRIIFCCCRWKWTIFSIGYDSSRILCDPWYKEYYLKCMGLICPSQRPMRVLCSFQNSCLLIWSSRVRSIRRPRINFKGPVGPIWARCWSHEPCYQGN